MKKKIMIVGAGAFGTALALTIHRAGHSVTLVTKSQDHAQNLTTSRINDCFSKDIFIPNDISITSETSLLVHHDVLVLAVPSNALTTITKSLFPFLENHHIPIVLSSKGIIDDNPLPSFPYEIIKKYFQNHPLALISGPNFAIEIAENTPTASDLVVENIQDYSGILSIFSHQFFRLYPSHDFIGVQLAGVIKNILAIGCGMASGCGYGANTTAAIMTRGLAEMTRLGLKMKAKLETFLGLSGVGDLMLTCSSLKSRNYTLGYQLGQGKKIQELINDNTPLSEGYHSAGPILRLAQYYNSELPLCNSIYNVLQGASIHDEIEKILSRPLNTNA